MNVLARGQIKRRDQMIQNKEGVIQKQSTPRSNSSMPTSALKRETIEENNRRIADAKQELARKIEKLKETQKKAKSSRQALQRAIADLREKSASESTNWSSGIARHRKT